MHPPAAPAPRRSPAATAIIAPGTHDCISRPLRASPTPRHPPARTPRRYTQRQSPRWNARADSPGRSRSTNTACIGQRHHHREQRRLGIHRLMQQLRRGATRLGEHHLAHRPHRDGDQSRAHLVEDAREAAVMLVELATHAGVLGALTGEHEHGLAGQVRPADGAGSARGCGWSALSASSAPSSSSRGSAPAQRTAVITAR